ncbi:MAG UNVERIFIED_CONTAM: HEAT repeat domain-containing protein [Planctomycetaceae bacterium]
MASPNGWWRDLAHRLLLHRRSELTAATAGPVMASLRQIANSGKAPAVQALAAVCQLLPDDAAASRLQELEAALASGDVEVRRMAVELLEPLLAVEDPSPAALKLLEHASSDPALLVQRQVLLSCGEVRTSAAASVLARLLLQHANHESLRNAALTSLHPQNIGSVLQQVLQSPPTPDRGALLSLLMSQAGAMGATEELTAPLTSQLQASERQLRRRQLAAGDRSAHQSSQWQIR